MAPRAGQTKTHGVTVETATRHGVRPSGRHQAIHPPVRVLGPAIDIAPAYEQASEAASTHRIAGCGVGGLRRVRAIARDLGNTAGIPIAREPRLPGRQRASAPALEAASAFATA